MATASHYSDYAMDCLTKELFNSQQEQEIFLYSKTLKPDLGPIHPPVDCIIGFFLPTVKQPGYDANHSYSLSSKVKNAWNYTGTGAMYIRGTIYCGHLTIL
jgi:hypothetical protein